MIDDGKIDESMFKDGINLTEKQLDILVAATALFAEKGYAATSTSEIAKKAGVAEGTIFRHYKTKKELLMSIVTPMMVKLIAPTIKKDVNKVLDKDFESFESFIKAMIFNRSKFIEENMPLFRIIIQEIPFHPELKEQFIEHVGKELMGRLMQIVQHFQAKGQISNMPVQTVIRVTISTIFGYIMTKNILARDIDWDDEGEMERTVEFLMNGLSPR